MDDLYTHTRSLEDAYFQQGDQFLIDNLRDLKKLEETRENLATVSGIRDKAVLDRFVELGIQPPTLSSLAVVPLVAVAWADGSLDAQERQAILDAVHHPGFAHGIDLKLVGHWLETKPKPGLIEAWRQYSLALAGTLTEEQRHCLRDELVGRARRVAEAAGGFLGLHRISDAEQGVLDSLEAAWN